MNEPIKSKPRMQVFYGADAEDIPDDMMPREGIDDSVLAALTQLAESGVTEGVGERNRVLFRQPGEQGMSLVHVWFKSGYVLPFHSHSTDCLYYVIAGELRMGSRTLRKGDGMFVPADHGYGYEAGPEGVELLEFRQFAAALGADRQGLQRAAGDLAGRNRAAVRPRRPGVSLNRHHPYGQVPMRAQSLGAHRPTTMIKCIYPSIYNYPGVQL